MQITKHGDNLIQLTKFVAFNCFLVREDDGFTAVDTNMGGCAEAMIAAAQQAGGQIKRITLTHAHIDHVGSLDALHTLLPDAEVSMTARDARFMTGDKSLDADEPQDKPRGGYPICTTKPTRFLKPGDRVGSLEVVASPGHTPGHIAFLDRRDGTLFGGDAFTTQAGISTAGSFRLLFPFPAMATWSKETGIQSAEALIALKPTRLAVGHGKVLVNPVSGMQQAVDEAHKLVDSR